MYVGIRGNNACYLFANIKNILKGDNFMNKIIRTLLVVMTLALALVAFTSCDEFNQTVCEVFGHDMTVVVEEVLPTYKTAGHRVTACANCGHEETETLDMLVAKLPAVTVTEIECADPALTFALNFGIKDAESLSEDYLEALFAAYGSCYVDYVLTIDGLTSASVTFNENGTVDGYLAGQYDAWSEEMGVGWVSVPFGNSVTVNNGESFYIMEYAAELLGKPGLRYTLEEVATIVVNFNCGVYFTEEFLTANPDMVVTLQLVVFNVVDGEKVLVEGGLVAENVFTNK